MTIEQSHQETRDSISNTDETKNLVLVGIFDDNINAEEGATILTRSNIGSSFVLGHPTNAILGTTALGMANDYVLGQVERVINPNNTFHEHFRFNNFNDTINTTGTFSTTYFNVSMDNDEIFQSLDIFKNVQSINYITVYVDLTGSKREDGISIGGGKIVTLTEGQ